MVLNVSSNPAWKKMKVGRVILISGMLTFLFLVEFCIGLRNLYYIFNLWHDASRIPSSDKQAVSWTLCVACLLLCVLSSFTVSLISAMWEQKQLAENGKEKNLIRFALHILVSGMIWRYVSLWFADNKTLQKKEALLLTLLKFFFTQFFTIPMVIVHASSSEKLEEIIYDVCSVSCISVNLILTCTVFTWCKAEVTELKNWNYETIDLVPLIFCQSSDDPQCPSSSTDQCNTDAKCKEVKNNNPSACCDLADDNFESALVRIIVLFQTFSFTFGRLLALGVLFKLAGIYALTILFLQLLISVVYLKFQVPFLVSDSLPKWRQLTRLAFMSYILIFEWHLNRDPKTAYDFTSNIKHSMLYYFIATLESVFYFVTWAITEAFTSNTSFNDHVLKRKFSRNVIIMGIMSLMFSLVVHFLLLFWHSRRLSSFINSMQKSYLKSKMRIVNNARNKDKSKSDALEASKQHTEISDPSPTYDSSDGYYPQKDDHSTVEKRNSYKDLREPIDDEIEIYARKNNDFISNKKTAAGKKTKAPRATERELYNKSENPTSCNDEKPKDDLKKRRKEPKINLKNTSNAKKSNKNKTDCKPKDNGTTVISMNDSNSSQSESDTKTKKTSDEPNINPAPRTKKTQLSESINERWDKFTSIPMKFTGTMRDQLQKRKEQFKNYRNSSSENSTDSQQKNDEGHCSAAKNSKVDSSPIVNQSKEEIDANETSEAYFIGDSQGYEDQQYDSGEDIASSDDNFDIDDQEIGKNSAMEDTSDCTNQKEQSHVVDGDDPCPCDICIPEEGGVLRRRSSSAPSVDVLPRQQFLTNMIQEDFPSRRSSMVRYPSSPSIVRVDMKPVPDSDADTCSQPPDVYPRGRLQSLSVFAADDRIEHYV